VGAGAFFFEELRTVATLAPTLVSSSDSVDLFLLTLEGLDGLKDEFGEESNELNAATTLTDAVLTNLLGSLAEKYHSALAVQFMFQGRLTRRLADLTPAPTAYNASSGELTVSEIANYQICLWTGVVLVLAVLSAVCCLINMDIRPDSLLYAKFQADVSSKLE
jgi:hypothetical protein